MYRKVRKEENGLLIPISLSILFWVFICLATCSYVKKEVLPFLQKVFVTNASAETIEN